LAFSFWSLFAFSAIATLASGAGPVYVYGGSFNLPIPAANSDKGPMDDAVIDITGHLLISDINVVIDIVHTNIFDLEIILQGPGGQQVCLNAYYDPNDFFRAQDYSQTIFDDEAALAIEQGNAPFTGSFRPKVGNSLSVFDGTDAFGQWRLQIDDLYRDDKGSLENFELIITVPEPATFVLFALSGCLLRRRA
jgi:subtilisin-like proprotein convertase family protein